MNTNNTNTNTNINTNTNTNTNNNNNTYQQDFFNNYLYYMQSYLNSYATSIDYLNNSSQNIREMTRNLDYYYYNLYNRNLQSVSNNNIYNRTQFYNQSENYNQQFNHNQQFNYNNSSPYLENTEWPDLSNNSEHESNTTEYQNNSENENNLDNTEEYYQNLSRNNLDNTEEYYQNLSRNNLENAINNKITKLKYYEIQEPLNQSCAITQEDFTQEEDVAIINECKHVFNCNALIPWLKRHQTCPNCRCSILTGSQLIRYGTSNSEDERLFLTYDQFKQFISNHILSSVLNTSNRRSMLTLAFGG